MKKSNILTATAIAAATVGTVGIVQHIDALSAQYTTTSVLCMRKGPGTNYPVIRKLPKGQTVTVVSIDRYGWAKLNNSYSVSSLYLKRSSGTTSNKDKNSTTVQGVFKYTKTNLNMRKGPSTNYYKILTIKSGQKVKVLGTSGNWSKVIYNNAIGYVSSQFLTNTKPSTQTAINRITISLSSKKMKCYSNGKLVRTMDCAVGKSSTPTPQGQFPVVNKIKNRPYYKENIPGGAPNNPLGKYWVGLKVGKYNGNVYAIHGTNDESSVGKAVSHGCIRLHDYDILWLYNNVLIGCVVVIH